MFDKTEHIVIFLNWPKPNNILSKIGDKDKNKESKAVKITNQYLRSFSKINKERFLEKMISVKQSKIVIGILKTRAETA